MGKIRYETYDPDDLELPNDTDFEYEGIDEEYETYREYETYLPDKLSRMAPLSESAKSACKRAEDAMREATRDCVMSSAAAPVSWLLLYDEAVSTTQAENYPVTCSSMLEYKACESRTANPRAYGSIPETAALDAVDALREFVTKPSSSTTIDDICRVNEMFGRTSPRAELCGMFRERPVFIGRSLFDADFVPMSSDFVDEYMSDLIDFMNRDDPTLGPVAKAAIAHSQFVTIHPFEDGNGRTGRAIAQRVLAQDGVTAGLMMPTTSAIVTQKPNYIHAIQQTRTNRGLSDQSPFVEFFADCCEGAALQTRILESRMTSILGEWHRDMPQRDATAQKALEAFASMPVMTPEMLDQTLGRDGHDVANDLLNAGIVSTRPSRFTRGDVYVADKALNALEQAQQLHGTPLQTSRSLAEEMPDLAQLRARVQRERKTTAPVKSSVTGAVEEKRELEP